jgi:hypothetical protein
MKVEVAEGGSVMPHAHYTGEEISRRGENLYEKSIRAKVETEDNVGKIIAIDIESGDYEIGNDVIAVGRRLIERRPNAATWTKRVGFDAVFALGGTLTRTTK